MMINIVDLNSDTHRVGLGAIFEVQFRHPIATACASQVSFNTSS